jgi:23S rRNA pseudouridine1911/1915/1917 synthase
MSEGTSEAEQGIELERAGGSTGLLHVVGADEVGQRLDRVLARAAQAAGLSLSRTRLKGLLDDGHVRIAGSAAAAPDRRVALGDELVVRVPPAIAAAPQPQAIPFAIVFEDEHLLVLDKPAGLVVHPSAGHADGTLVNALMAHCGETLSGINGVKRPGIVHRLDRDTSGLLAVAKTDAAHAGLAAIFADHGRSGSLVREYVAYAWGVPDQGSGTVRAALGRDARNRLKMAVVPEGRGRQAVTHWLREANFGRDVSRLRCRLETGRTHQIRVHMAAIGHPLLGDGVYGAGFRTKAGRLGPGAAAAVAALGRQALHAQTLGFAHPVTGQTLRFSAALPSDLADLESGLTSI